MNNKYEVKLEKENNGIYLSATHNGSHWTSIRIDDPEQELPLIEKAIRGYIKDSNKTERKVSDRFTIEFLVEDEDSVNHGLKVDAEVVYDGSWIFVNVDDENEDEERLSFYRDCENMDADEVGSILTKLREKDKVFTWDVIEDDLGFDHNAPGA